MAETVHDGDLANWQLRQLVAAGVYPDEQAALRTALRALFQSQPEAKVRMVVNAYAAGTIGLGKAAALLGVSQEEMKDISCEAGAGAHLGAQTAEELREDVRNA
jgi:predicted HTH domain antitoxin